MINYTHTGDFVFFSPPHGVYFSSPIQTDQTANGAVSPNLETRHAGSTLNFEHTPHTSPSAEGLFFRVLDFFGVYIYTPAKTKTRIRPLFRHPQHIKIDVLGDLNAQYTCLRCRAARGITLLTRLRGLDRASCPHRGACDSFHRRSCA